MRTPDEQHTPSQKDEARLILFGSWCSSEGGDAPCTKNDAERDLELPHPWDKDVSVADGCIVNPVKGTKVEHARLFDKRVGGNSKLRVSECDGQEHEANDPGSGGKKKKTRSNRIVNGARLLNLDTMKNLAR